MKRPLKTRAMIEGGNGQYAQWDGKPMRCPKKGELFLSGAHQMAYRAYQDMNTPYFIAVPMPGKETTRINWPGY